MSEGPGDTKEPTPRPYEIRIERAAEKVLTKRRVQADDAERIRGAVDALAEDPRPHPQSSELQGRAGRRLRVGDYRIIYDVDEPHPDYQEPGSGEPVGLITVWAIGHRQGIYG